MAAYLNRDSLAAAELSKLPVASLLLALHQCITDDLKSDHISAKGSGRILCPCSSASMATEYDSVKCSQSSIT